MSLSSKRYGDTGFYLDTDFATILIIGNAAASSVRTSKMHGSVSKRGLVPTAGLVQYFFPRAIALGIGQRDVYVPSFELMHVVHLNFGPLSGFFLILLLYFKCTHHYDYLC